MMFKAIFYYASCIALGFLVPFYLALVPALCVLSIVVVFALYMLYTTHDLELGAIIGWIAAWWSGIFTLVFVVTAFFVYGNTLNLSWILR